MHLLFFDEMLNIGELPWSWFLGMVLGKKNLSYLFISSITNEIRHFHVAVMQWLIKTVYLSKPIAFLTFSMPWSYLLLKLPNYWKISVPFLSQGIIISSLHIREVCPSKMINITVTKIRNLNKYYCTTLTVLKIISMTKSRMLKSWSNLGHLIWKRN